MELDVLAESAPTEVGNYFVSNYPPFSAWSAASAPAALGALDTPAGAVANRPPLGLYLHIPFCRKRCHFCYFRVYTDKNSADVQQYADALAAEVALYAGQAALAGRQFEFVYFGGGTPSFLSSEQLSELVERISKHWTWANAREVTFECEPGTLKLGKLKVIRAIGVTRLSLGIEHFDDHVLELNGRAHKSPEIDRAYGWAREVGFPQINIDLIAGMVGDTEDGWKRTVDRALALNPDSVTIYQMEVPHNTGLARDAKASGSATPVADWATKRRWVDYAFSQFEREGYRTSSAYTVARPSDQSSFVYRDMVWHGADMIGTGVASFSHFAGVHFQNADSWDEYLSRVASGNLPIARALEVSSRERLTREFVLQMKLGVVPMRYFRDKFGESPTDIFQSVLTQLAGQELLAFTDDEVRLSRRGLLCVDALLPRFFDDRFRGVRYT